MEEEIDLKAYIAVIVRRWYWIVGLTIVAGLAAYMISGLLTSQYETEAKIIILRATTNISFEPRIQSGSPSEAGQGNLRNNQETLVNLVTSSSVAEQVLMQLPEIPDRDEFTVSDLLKKIDSSNIANLISIRVRDTDPDLAARIANLWAETYVSFVNQLYSDRSDTLLTEVEQQVAEANTTYQAAQSRLEEALNSNQLAILQRDIGLLNKDLNSKYNTVELTFSKRNELLTQKYNELNRIERWLDDTKNLQDQLSAGTSSKGGELGDALAVMQLRQKAFEETTRVQLHLNLSEIDENLVTSEDADTIIAVIEAHKTRILAEIETLSADILADQNELIISETSAENEFIQAVEPILAKIAELESESEAQKAQMRELLTARDRAWENLQAVSRKLAEVTLETRITDSEVKLASSAVIPESPISPRPALNAVIGAALGFMVAVVLILVVSYWSQIVQLTDEDSVPAKQGTLPSEAT